MSPEPRQEPLEETLTAPNQTAGAAINDSDSEDEDGSDLGQYMPLSQVPIDNDSLLDDDEDNHQDFQRMYTFEDMTSSFPMSSPQETSIDTPKCSRSNIDLDAEKIDQVKNVMASISLPSTSIPSWANTISEDQWKEQLMIRIKKMQENEADAQ